MGHLSGINFGPGRGDLNNNFQKSQMPGGLPGGSMLKLRFDRYITVKTRALRRKGVDTLWYCRRLLTANINVSSYALKDIKMTCRCFSAEFAYCEADITFFAARHDEDTRQWLFKDFDKWFSDPGDSRAYVLLGDAGIGKSVIAGALTQRARNKGHLGAAYFCRHNDGTTGGPDVVCVTE